MEALLVWFYKNKRDLPWRRARDPYRVWVAESMLQQTQAATVKPYYARWLERFPDVYALAAAPLDEVLKRWEGLGYYRRARLLHASARQLVANHEGELPSSYQELLALPGIGRYTAAAIASIAFGEKVLAIDGNVRRVASRLYALAEPTDAVVRERIEPEMPEARPGDFNEALMDLGATICTPRAPDCPRCPLSFRCAAFKVDAVAAYPPQKARKALLQVFKYAWLYRNNDDGDGALWLYRRDENEMLGGLWGFPLKEEAPASGRWLPEVKHAYTHFRLTVQPIVLKDAPPEGAKGRFIAPAELKSLALSTLDHKILRLLLSAAQEEESHETRAV